MIKLMCSLFLLCSLLANSCILRVPSSANNFEEGSKCHLDVLRRQKQRACNRYASCGF
ncbi:hypothetical protein PF010_g17044 [Phytophthora fragariae]|uniref:RxLR effector protein n=1 Tax=Phytophthora fragariae TaxID=53985 RepID=A0A6G0KPJ6_9STRA|nr:hypothetical protein PF010_g17044 [Phytophthora fragariae]KAE9209240.1 hypothetical protein PF004_g16525 [Phytophthora fragariae]KAE9354688.1 hypothetical protein PF008_g4410 [Phytophthora fragariae]